MAMRRPSFLRWPSFLKRPSSLLMLFGAVTSGLASLPMLPLSRGGSVTVVDPEYQIELVARNGYRMPDGLLWRPEGLYFADDGAALFQRLTSDGVERLHFPNSHIHSLGDVAANGMGDFYFTDREAGGVWHWNGSLGMRLLAGPEQGLRRTAGLAVSPAGDIFVGDAELHSIFRISPTGLTQIYATGIQKPETLAFDPAGGLYVGDDAEGKIYYIANARPKLVVRDPGIVPETIAWHGDGLLITDSVHGRLYRWTPGAVPEVIAAFGGVLRRLMGVAADDRDNIWVSVQTSVPAKKGYLFKLKRAQKTTSRSRAPEPPLPLNDY